MEMTESLYCMVPAIFSYRARVIAVEGSPDRPVLIVDRTPFYPEGGGQPADAGTIAGVPVEAVTEEGGRILHRLAGPLAVGVGDEILLEVDPERRNDHAGQHSAQHLLSSIFLARNGAATLSFHLGAERSSIDLDLPGLSAEDLAGIEAEANRIIALDLPIRTHRCPPEDPASFPLRKRLPAGEALLRIVEIDGLDWTPCCGTHVGSTGQLGLVAILSGERYKGGTRVGFVAAGRARERYAFLRREAAAAARALGTGLEGLAPEAERVVSRLADALAARRALQGERAALEAELADLRGGPTGMPLFLSLSDRSAEDAQELARALAGRGRASLVLSLPDLAACAALPGPPPAKETTKAAVGPTAVGPTAAGPTAAGPTAAKGAGLAELLKPLALAAGGKGGGGPTAFRAAFSDRRSLLSFEAAVRPVLPAAGRAAGPVAPGDPATRPKSS